MMDFNVPDLRMFALSDVLLRLEALLEELEELVDPPEDRQK